MDAKTLTESDAFFVLSRLPPELQGLVSRVEGGRHIIRMPTAEEVRMAEEWKERLDLAQAEQEIMGETSTRLVLMDGRMQQLTFEQSVVYDALQKAMKP